MQSLAVIEFPTQTRETFDMAQITLATLAERVDNHIKFFWAVVACGFVWMATLSVLLYHVNDNVRGIAIAQADVPANLVAKLLSGPRTSSTEVASRLDAASTILRSSKIGKVKPDISALKTVSANLAEVQDKYPDLPQVWQATSAFINYKSEALSPSPLKTSNGVKCRAEFNSSNGFVFSNCEVTLEDLAEHVKNNTLDGSPAPFTFINCIVHYNGGNIPAKRLMFVGCIFRFQVPTVPPREGVLAMRQLTTTDNTNTVNLSLG